jgi:uncharacterized repeat protein (TIGR02543 family)
VYVGSSGGKIKVNDVVQAINPSTHSFDTGTTVIVEAVPSFGYTFEGWTGDLSGTTNPATIAIDCNKSITATFSINRNIIGLALVILAVIGYLITFFIIRRKAG